MRSIRDFTDVELQEQIENATLDLEEAENKGDYNAAYAELTVAKREKRRREDACNCYECELIETCEYINKLQRLPRNQGGLGLCKKL